MREPSRFPDSSGGWFHPSGGSVPSTESPTAGLLGSRDKFQESLFKGWAALEPALVEADRGGLLLEALNTLTEGRCVRGREDCNPTIRRGRSGRYRYRCECCMYTQTTAGEVQRRNVGIVDAYASGHRSRVGVIPAAHYGLWALRLLREAGSVPLQDPAVMRVELDASPPIS